MCICNMFQYAFVTSLISFFFKGFPTPTECGLWLWHHGDFAITFFHDLYFSLLALLRLKVANHCAFQESLGDSEIALRTPNVSNGNQVPKDASDNRSSSSGMFGISRINASFLTRTHSLTSSVLRQVRSSTQQS